MKSQPPVRVSVEDDVAWVEINNPPVNATSTETRAGLIDAVALVEASDARAAILICEGKTFIAGGDMSEFDAPPREPHLPDVVDLIERSRVPWIAAMHGNVLGGGFEIALGCAWRIALSGTRFGLPEVNVGLIPGAGGTQRLPRLVPMVDAINMACRGSLMPATALLEVGAIDRIVDGDLRAGAVAFVAELPDRPSPISARTANHVAPDYLDAEREKLRSGARGQQSPLHNLTALQWASLPFSAGQTKERALHLELRNSAESRALRYAFFAERELARPKLISGVSDEGAAQMAQDRVKSNLDGALKRGKSSEAQRDARFAALATSDNLHAVRDHELVIEAVFEDIDVKRDVFGPNPERCFGLHFFSPAHIMKLIEIVHLPQTSPQTIANAFEIAKTMRKIGVLSGVCDGFIGNRLLAAYRREAEYLLADGALPEQVDRAMRGFGYAMGPFEAQDLSGLQIAWANRKATADKRDPSIRYVPIADRLCEAGRLGQHSGNGWYDYSEDARIPKRSHIVERLITDYSREAGITRRVFSDDELVERLLAVLANEGLMIVEEGIAENAAAVDMVLLHGYGFPRWRGGPMRYAEEVGFSETARTMAKLSNESPSSWEITKALRL